ncbi:MAG: organic solvent tolerance protein OstA [Bradyrhizobium sp.]|nr:MAG: organic solvent tolerance protein OstA [Bradyrhizobium sp.]
MTARCRSVLALALALLAAGPAVAATKDLGTPLLPGAGSKQPVSVEADKLVYFDKEQKAVYSGNVVVIQGDTKMTCSMMTIFMEKGATAADASQPAPAATPAATPASGAAPSASSSHVRHLDAAGPVTVISKTQVATADRGAYDKAQNKVWLIGNVTLSDGGNVTKGDKLTYDLTTGQATIDTGAAGRVKGLFVPGSSPDDKNATPK